MAWDPTDYKDMLDDDWNDRHHELQVMLDDEFFGGVYIDEMRRRAAKILGNPKVIDDQEFEKMVNSQKADIEDLAKYLMDNFYLTPMGRKRARMKTQKNESLDMKRAKYVKESLEEDEFSQYDLDNEDFQDSKDVDDFDDESDNYEPEGDDDIDNAATNEVMAVTSHALEELFQQAAENGLTFEMLQDLAEQALDQVDWVAAGQM